MTCIGLNAHCGFMRYPFSRLFACGSLIITSAVASGNAASLPSADGSVKMPVLAGRPVMDGVYLNGEGPFRFLIDTGAESNQVEASIARKIRLKATFRTEIDTITGGAVAAGGRVEKVTVGPATASGQEFLITSLEAVHQLSPGIQGVLGQEFLSRFDYLLDFSGRRIVFGAAHPDGGNRITLNLIDRRPAIETDRGTLVIDSGSAVAILYADPAGRSGERVFTAAGSGVVSRTWDLKLRLAGRAYNIIAATVPHGSMREAGVLPASLFHSIYVSNSGKFLVLDPAARMGR